MSKLKERIDNYNQITNYKLLPHTPTIISINGRNFSKATSLLEKPYDIKLAECFFSTTLKLCSEIEGIIFGYHYNDEIVLIIHNHNMESQDWCDNNIQKICSIISSISTLYFNENTSVLKLNINNPMFVTNIFQVPTVSEIVNCLIYKQQHNFLTAIQLSCFYELLNHYDKNTIKEMLLGLTVDEKIDLLKQEVDINFNDYPQSFRRGIACYKIPQIINGAVKNKWIINSELPIFTKEQSFLSNIIKHGMDIFRNNNL